MEQRGWSSQVESKMLPLLGVCSGGLCTCVTVFLTVKYGKHPLHLLWKCSFFSGTFSYVCFGLDPLNTNLCLTWFLQKYHCICHYASVPVFESDLFHTGHTWNNLSDQTWGDFQSCRVSVVGSWSLKQIVDARAECRNKWAQPAQSGILDKHNELWCFLFIEGGVEKSQKWKLYGFYTCCLK